MGFVWDLDWISIAWMDWISITWMDWIGLDFNYLDGLDWNMDTLIGAYGFDWISADLTKLLLSPPPYLLSSYRRRTDAEKNIRI